MKITTLVAKLQKLFDDRDTRVVFWDDAGAHFENDLPAIQLEGVEMIELSACSSLQVKVQIELGPPERQYLLYLSEQTPPADEDWLCDIRLYSPTFRADYDSIVLAELGLHGSTLREHVRKRRKFFKSAKRTEALKAQVSARDTPLDLDRKMLAVATKAATDQPFDIFLALLHSWAPSPGGAQPHMPPPRWKEIERLDLSSTFWKLTKQLFGYSAPTPSIADWVHRVLVTDLSHALRADRVPQTLQNLVLKPPGIRHAVVFAAQWRDSHRLGSSYNWWADRAWRQLAIISPLCAFHAEELAEVHTFSGIDAIIAQELAHRLAAQDHAADAEETCRVCEHRKQGHWITSHSVPKDVRDSWSAVYEALAAAARLLELRSTHQEGFGSRSGEELYRWYERELFRFDQLYRQFRDALDAAPEYGAGTLKRLARRVEDCYSHWFLTELALAWSLHIDACLPRRWECGSVPQQKHFFTLNVSPYLHNRGAKRRAFVIISDALRFEAGEALMRRLNGQRGIDASLTSQLGVLPSYTALGMASLLPHRALHYAKSGSVLVDGQPSGSLEQRDAVLKASASGIAVNAKDLLAMSRQEGRALVGGARVVYIYHNEIDAVGDSRNTESEACAATRRAINTLTQLIKHLINSLNATYVLVTADHGFVYTATQPAAPDHSPLTHEPPRSVISKQRYLLGKRLPTADGTWLGHTKTSAGAGGDMQFLIPKAYNRFNFRGSTRFFHGGAMLQEVCIPIITVREKRDKVPPRHAQVQVLGHRFRITTKLHRFELLQTEAVSEMVLGVTLKVAIYAGSIPISNVQTIRLNSTSAEQRDRIHAVTLTLRDLPHYDKRAKYHLRLTNAEAGALQQEIEVTIDRVLDDDF